MVQYLISTMINFDNSESYKISEMNESKLTEDEHNNTW